MLRGFFSSIAGRIFIVLVSASIFLNAIVLVFFAPDRQKLVIQVKFPQATDQLLHHGEPSIFHVNLLWVASFFLIVIAFLSLIIARVTSQPLRELARAARSLGNNVEQSALLTSKGPVEAREAFSAFNMMQERIRQHAQERTFMLAELVRDLQTPLTRLKSRLEQVVDIDLKNRLMDDVADTQELVKQGLVYVQLVNADEPFESVDLDLLIAAIYHDAIKSGSDVTLTGKIGKPILASPHAIKRCISNLVENAIKYGSHAHIHVYRENNKAIIAIADAGPGIPDDQLDSVFLPFKCVEGTTSQNSGATGLGLTIARIIANRHQATINLKNIKAGGLGLIVTLELPELGHQQK